MQSLDEIKRTLYCLPLHVCSKVNFFLSQYALLIHAKSILQGEDNSAVGIMKVFLDSMRGALLPTKDQNLPTKVQVTSEVRSFHWLSLRKCINIDMHSKPHGGEGTESNPPELELELDGAGHGVGLRPNHLPAHSTSNIPVPVRTQLNNTEIDDTTDTAQGSEGLTVDHINVDYMEQWTGGLFDKNNGVTFADDSTVTGNFKFRLNSSSDLEPQHHFEHAPPPPSPSPVLLDYRHGIDSSTESENQHTAQYVVNGSSSRTGGEPRIQATKFTSQPETAQVESVTPQVLVSFPVEPEAVTYTAFLNHKKIDDMLSGVMGAVSLAVCGRPESDNVAMGRARSGRGIFELALALARA